jgi:signal recognition particle GTPase
MIDADSVMDLTRRMAKGDFTFGDFLSQMQMLRKMGGMAGMLKMLPGVAGKISKRNIQSCRLTLHAVMWTCLHDR